MGSVPVTADALSYSGRFDSYIGVVSCAHTCVQALLWLEECQMKWDVNQYDLHDITLDLDTRRYSEDGPNST